MTHGKAVGKGVLWANTGNSNEETMIVVGVDPDSVAFGIAIYRDGELKALESWTLIEIRTWIAAQDGEMIFSIENVLANNFLYSRNRGPNRAVNEKTMLSVGRCQQAQAELMRELDHQGIPYQLVKPTKSNWANDNRTFQRITKWAGRSNSDTRSAAYFGFLLAGEQASKDRG